MIRINLLESASKKRKKMKLPTGAPVVALYVMLLVLECLLLYYWSTIKDDVLVQASAQTKEVQAKVEDLKALKAQIESLEKEMKEAEQQAQIFQNLHNATVGPSNLLIYLSYMLSVPKQESHAERVAQEQIGWDTKWDPDRAWFTEMKETKEGKVTFTGRAISHYDTDEILRRLKTTVFLQGVHFVSAKVTRNDKSGNNLVDFKIDAFLNYDPEVGKDKAVDKKGKKGKKGDKKDPKKKAQAQPNRQAAGA